LQFRRISEVILGVFPWGESEENYETMP